MKIIKTSTYEHIEDIELVLRGREILKELEHIDAIIEEGDMKMVLRELDRVAIVSRLNNVPFNVGIDCSDELDYENRLNMRNIDRDKIIEIVNNLKSCIEEEIEEAEKREIGGYASENVNPSIHSLEHTE